MATPGEDIHRPADIAQKQAHLDTFAHISVARKERLYSQLRVGPGSQVLDVGCGVGADTLPLSRLVGPTGRVLGVDSDPASIAEANRRAAAAGLGAWVDHQVGDAYALPVADATVDACHSERVFLHLQHPERAFAEIVRVTRPGGWIAIVDGDGASFSIDTPEAVIERRIIPFWAAKHVNGYAGRQLYRTFKAHGLADVTAELHFGPIYDFALFARLFGLDDIQERARQAGAVTAEEVARFRASLEAAASAGTFFATGGSITVVGRKP